MGGGGAREWAQGKKKTPAGKILGNYCGGSGVAAPLKPKKIYIFHPENASS